MTMAFSRITRRCTGTRHPDDTIQRTAITDSRHASWRVGQERLDYAPLEVDYVISTHAEAESRLRMMK